MASKNLKSEVVLAKDAFHCLASNYDGKSQVAIELNGESVILPSGAVKGLMQVLKCQIEGKDAYIQPREDELTTQKAADFLNVSRPYLVKLLESGEIPFTKNGSHRRVKYSDLLKFRQEQDRISKLHISKLVASGQQDDMGY